MTAPGRPPRVLWVGEFEFPFNVVAANDEALKDDAGVASDGMTIVHEDGRGIWISNALDLRRTLTIVLHEVTHTLNWSADIEDGADEEAIASGHGTAWAQLLLDNPQFLQWLAVTTTAIRMAQGAGGHDAEG